MRFLDHPYQPDQFVAEKAKSFEPSKRSKDSSVYLAHSQTAHAVNLALSLEVPLLITGESGVGKTRLADSVLNQLNHQEERWKLLRYQVKSDSKTKDLLYHFDAIGRIYEGNVEVSDRVRDPRNFITYNALGEAIRRSLNNQYSIVLIDEIDKAPDDLPNGLLRELDEWAFEVPELKVPALSQKDYEFRLDPHHPIPLVLITSNDERKLPDAFLRRCLVHEIPFPEKETLKTILLENLKTKKPAPLKDGIDIVVDQFEALRDLQPPLEKKPSIGDLLMWMRSLVLSEVTEQDLKNIKRLSDLPNLEALLKQREDVRRIKSDGK